VCTGSWSQRRPERNGASRSVVPADRSADGTREPHSVKDDSLGGLHPPTVAQALYQVAIHQSFLPARCVEQSASTDQVRLVAVVFSAADKGPSVSAVVQLTSNYCTIIFFKSDM